MTLLITSIAPQSMAELEQLAKLAWDGGASAVEVRIDGFDGNEKSLADYLGRHPRRTWIITCRGTQEGGRSDEVPEARLQRVTTATQHTEALIDFEVADYERSEDIRRQLGELLKERNRSQSSLVLSRHDLKGRPSDLRQRVLDTLNICDGAIAKAAYKGTSASDGFDAIDLMYEFGGRCIAVCMGEAGLWTRVLAKKLGAFASYCAGSQDSATAPGQVPLADMVDRYRWHSITPSTRIFGVIGRPVIHSMSPTLMNHWFAQEQIDAVYLPFHVEAEGDELAKFLDGILERPWLSVGGFSVTIPHKTTALHWLGDRADRLATGIGAINTIAIRDKQVFGYNTDCCAAISSLTAVLHRDRRGLADFTVDVLGAGGAARAVVAGLRDIGCRVTIYGRSPVKTKTLAVEFACEHAPWDQRISRSGRILINATNVGMAPNIELSPMPAESLDGCELIFDLIYNPLETKLLQDARAARIPTLNGLDMFVRQAAAQVELWTGKTPDIESGRKVVARKLQA